MPRPQTRSKNHRRRSVSSSSSSSSSSSNHKSRNKRRESEKRRGSEKRRESEKKHNCKESKESSSDTTIVYSNDKHKSDSESDCKNKCDFDELYNYYKYRLVRDESLMVAGSGAFLDGYYNETQSTPQTYPVLLDAVSLSRNVDALYKSSPFYVREAGIYLIIVVINSEQSSQFSFYINGVARELTRTGNNSGAGQLMMESLIRLNENDAILVRNDESAQPSVISQQYIGGTQLGNNTTSLLFKVAPLPDCKEKCDWDEKCISRRKRSLFKKLTNKLVADPELMMNGFNVHGSFYTTLAQSIPLEADVMWDNYQNVQGMTWSASNPNQVVVGSSGVYKIFFLGHVAQAAQAGIAINGVVNENTVQGTNKGSSQFTVRSLLNLKAGDIISIKNHSSASGQFTITQQAGGAEFSIAGILTVVKIANCAPPTVICTEVNKYYCELYEKFRCYLLNQGCLQVAGSPVYCLSNSDNIQSISPNAKLDWSQIALQHNVRHTPGKPSFTVERDGIYTVYIDVLFNEPSQIAIFVNGLVNSTTIGGRDSGGGKNLIRQILDLKCGDELDVRNYTSYGGAITSAINGGGIKVGQNMSFAVIRLSPSNENHKHYCGKDSKKDKSKSKN